MNRPEHDPSIEHEPHRQHLSHPPDPSEAAARRQLSQETPSLEDHVEHSVWDELGVSANLVGKAGPNDLTYANWLEYRIAGTSRLRCWSTTLLVSLVAGPLAVLGALWQGGESTVQIIAVTIVGPLAEETFKIAAALWVVEKRPYLFCSSLQIVICSLASGFVFAAIENILYLNVYIPDPSPELVSWRWSVCVALHMGCTWIAGLGLVRVWKQTIDRKTKPNLSPATPMICTAIVIHGVYNALAIFIPI